MTKNIYPRTIEKAGDMKVYVNGQEVEVIKTSSAYFAAPEIGENAEIEIEYEKPPKEVAISPKRAGISYEVVGRRVKFILSEPKELFINAGEVKLPLFFYGVKPEVYDGKADYYFKGGQIYEVGALHLTEGQSVYIERGAVVKGCIFARNADNIKIYGQGVLDNSYYKDEGHKKTIFLINCNNVVVENLILIEPTTWMLVLAGCSQVHVKGLKEIGTVVSSDGIDIVGSNHVLIENCFLRNNDDCIVIKYNDMAPDITKEERDAVLKPVHDILARNCVLFNSYAGNAIEIGHELRCPHIRDVVFKDIDILRVDGVGAALSIHGGDEALISHILFEDIYIEHYYEKLIDLRVMKSMYNKSPERGRIENIRFKNIQVTKSIYNFGYTVSTIGGYDENHVVDGIYFENFYLNDQKVMNGDDLDLFTKHAFNINFC